THGIRFEILSTDTDGEVFLIQTGQSSETDMGTNGINYLITGTGVDNGSDTNDYIYAFDGAFTGYVANDSPATSLSSFFTNVSRSDSFTMHVMFRLTNSGAIPAPLKKVDWSWSAS